MSDALECANCGRAIDGAVQKFCPACGQATPVHRIDWHFLAHELEHSVLHMDRGILYSLRELMLRPGRLMRDYLEGRRARQAKPLLLLMVMAAAVVLASKYLVGEGVMDSIPDAAAAAAAQGDAAAPDIQVAMKASKAVADWMSRHFAAITLLLLPIEAAAFRLAFHRVGGLNYPEWLVITAFLTVQTFVFWTLLTLLHRWIPQPQLWAAGLAVLYGIVSLAEFFRGYPRWKSILRAVLGFAIVFVINALLTPMLVLAVAISMHG